MLVQATNDDAETTNAGLTAWPIVLGQRDAILIFDVTATTTNLRGDSLRCLPSFRILARINDLHLDTPVLFPSLTNKTTKSIYQLIPKQLKNQKQTENPPIAQMNFLLDGFVGPPKSRMSMGVKKTIDHRLNCLSFSDIIDKSPLESITHYIHHHGLQTARRNDRFHGHPALGNFQSFCCPLDDGVPY
jgi:hypothetical protein